MGRRLASRYVGPGLVALLQVGWASTWPVGKAALRTWTPVGLTATRHAIACVLLLGLARSMGARSLSVGWRELQVGLLQFCAYYVLTYLALEDGTTYAAAAAAGIYPIFVATALSLRAPPVETSPGGPARRKWLASSLALFGVGLLCADAGAFSGSASSKGLVLASLASVAMTVAVLTPRGASADGGLPGHLSFAGKGMGCGAVTTGLIALVRGDPWLRPSGDWVAPVAALLWLSLVGSAFVFVGIEWANKRYGPWKVSMAYASVPALVAVMGVAWLGETLRVLSVLGLAVTLAGLALAAVP